MIRHRGSSWAFAPEVITLAQLSTMLQQPTCGLPADSIEPFGATFTALYLIVNAVDELPSGTSVFTHERNVLELLRQGQLGLERNCRLMRASIFFALSKVPPY